MPIKAGNSRSSVRGTSSRRRNRSNGNPVDRQLAASAHAVGAGEFISVPADLTTRPVSTSIVQSPPKNLSNQIYWVRVTGGQSNGNAVSNSVDTLKGYSFELTDIANYAAYTALFDSFCIYAVIWQINVKGMVTGTAQSYGELCTVIDFDSAVPPSNTSTLQQYGTASTVALSYTNSEVQRFLKPCNAAGLYNGSVFTSYSVGRMWCDCATPSTQHYGIKVGFTNNNASNITFDTWATYIIGFRNNI